MNELKKEVSKYIALLSIDTLEEAQQSAKKVELSIYRNKKSYDTNSTDLSEELDEEERS